MKPKILSAVTGAALAAGLLGSCENKFDVPPSIASIAVANPDFQELEDAAIRGGVVTVLSNPNPAAGSNGKFTVFAPTNAAFARLGLNTAADLDALTPAFLTNTLLYNVGNGAVPGSALTAGSAPTASLLGPTRRVIVRADGGRYVNGSRILSTDVPAANGVIHPTDKVLLATGANIVASAVALSEGKVFVQPELTLLVAAVVRSGLATTLSDPTANFTVFAPTDAAFRAFGQKIGVPLNTPAEVSAVAPAILSSILLGHALPTGRFTPELNPNAAPAGATAATAGGGVLTFGAFENSLVTVKGPRNAAPANLVIPDVQCTNGVVHVIDQVLE